MVAEELTSDVVEIRRPFENIMAVKLVVGNELLTVYSVYAPQQGRGDRR